MKMSKKTSDYREDLIKRLQDKEYAAEYLNAALLDEDPKVFLIALKDVTDARGKGIANLAKKTHLNRESLYKTLSDKGNPRLSSLYLILEAVGLHLSISPANAV
jgi:probable addiction module antidote protein